jgi:hypothetical protein
VTIRDIIESKPGCLEDLAPISPFPNTVGRGGLVVSIDNRLLFSERSDSVVVDAGRLDLPVQGSADIGPDDKEYDVFRDFKAEANLELGISGDNYLTSDVGDDAIVLMAVTRNVARGGKPEFLFLANSRLSADEIIRRARNAEHNWEHKQIVGIDLSEGGMRSVRGVLSGSRLAPDCRAALAAFEQWVQQRGLDVDVPFTKILEAIFGATR